MSDKSLLGRIGWIPAAMWLFVWSGAPLSAQVDAPALEDDVRTTITSGMQLERDRKWRDAIQLYKSALEAHPENEYLTWGLRRSQFQFGIDRRYTDQSFRDELLKLSRFEALALFDEIADKIQTHFVDSMTLTSLVAHGTESLWLSLANERFLDENLFGADPKRIAQLRQALRDRYWNKPIPYRESARQTINEVCDLAQKTVGLDGTAVALEYAFAACNCLDDYSNVLTPARLADLHNNIDGEFVGIGIVMEAKDGKGMALINVLPESPAAESGLRPGDHIVRIDGVDCRDLSTDEAAGMLTGRSGTEVRLEVEAPGGPVRSAACTRREVKVKSIPVAKIVDAERGIAYIQMTGFQKNSAVELDMALARLNREGMRSIIWDLRGNPGGLLPTAVEVLDRFLASGTIVSTRGRTPDQDYIYTAHAPGTWDLPLVLLIDGNSASASEIVAGAVRDQQRGQIVGRRSFGKWSVQSIYPMRDGTGLRLTTAKFYSPNGHTWGKIGIKPDVAVEVTDDDIRNRPVADVDAEHDPDVRAAIEILRDTQFTRR